MVRSRSLSSALGVLLAAVLVASAGPALRAQVPTPDREGAKKEAEAAAPVAIPEPADPGAIRGTWTVGGQEKRITAGEFHEAHKLLMGLEGSVERGIREDQVWEYVLAASEASAMGIEVTDEELDTLLQRHDPDIYEGTLERWKAANVSEEAGLEYTRHSIAIRKLKDLYLNNDRITTRDAFDLFKQAHMLSRVEYLQFAAEDHRAELEAEGADEAKMRAWWQEDRTVPQRFRTQAMVSAEFVYLDPAQFDAAKAGAGSREVTREEALSYFNANRAALMAQVPPTKQHLLHFDKDTPLDKIVSPFEVLEETIKNRLVVDQVLDRVYSQSKEPGADLEKLAKSGGLGYRRVEDCDRARSIVELRPFGINAFATLFAAEPGVPSASILVEQQIRYFFRLTEKKEAITPEFDQVKDQVREYWFETKGAERARARAQGIIDAMNKLAMGELEERKKELDREALESADARIKELGLHLPAEQNREKMRAQGMATQKLEQEKRKALPKYFEPQVREHGLKVLSTDWFEFQMMRPDHLAEKDLPKARLDFLKSNYYVRALQPGEIAPAVLEDQHTKAYFVARLADRRDPPLESMGPVDLMNARAQLAQLHENELFRQFRYQGLRERLALKSQD